MPHPNLFVLANNGLRNELCHASVRLQHTDLSQPGTPGIIHQLEAFLASCRDILNQRVAFIHPYLITADGRTARQHKAGAKTACRLTTDLLDCLSRWRTALDAPARAMNGSKLCYDFHEYVAFCLCYMNRQEVAVMNALRGRYTSIELEAIAAEMLYTQSRVALAAEGRLIIHAASTEEAQTWMAQVRQHTAPSVAAAVLPALQGIPPRAQKMSLFFNPAEVAPGTFAL